MAATEERFIHPQVRQDAKIAKAKPAYAPCSTPEETLAVLGGLTCDSWAAFKRAVPHYAAAAATMARA